MSEEIYSFTDSISKVKSYLIVDRRDDKEFIILSGNVINSKGERIFYKTDKMLPTVSSGIHLFCSNKFLFSKTELALNQVLGIVNVKEMTEIEIPLMFKYKINYLAEFENSKVKVISISGFNDSKSDSIIIYYKEK